MVPETGATFRLHGDVSGGHGRGGYPRARPGSGPSLDPRAERGAGRAVGAERLVRCRCCGKEGSTRDPWPGAPSASPGHAPQVDFPLDHRPVLSSCREGIAAVVGEGDAGHAVRVAGDSRRLVRVAVDGQYLKSDLGRDTRHRAVGLRSLGPGPGRARPGPAARYLRVCLLGGEGGAWCVRRQGPGQCVRVTCHVAEVSRTPTPAGRSPRERETPGSSGFPPSEMPTVFQNNSGIL